MKKEQTARKCKFWNPKRRWTCRNFKIIALRNTDCRNASNCRYFEIKEDNNSEQIKGK